MTASKWVAAPLSIRWPQAGETRSVHARTGDFARSSFSVSAIGLATNFAQFALSFTPIDPRITIGLWSVAWPAVCTGRKSFRSLLSFVKESETMKKLDLFAIKLAKFGLVMLLGGVVSAHPGIEGTSIDNH